MCRGFELLYESGPCLVVGKPGGLLTQAPPGIDSLELRVRAYLSAREARQGGMYLVPVHRLDRPVSGALLLARNVRAARRLGEQFQGRLVRKVYWALAEGGVEPAEGRWDDWMRKVPDEPRAELVGRHEPRARRAVLDYRVLGAVAGATLLEIELHTGRMHQIRLQAGSRGHPLLGDFQYGSRTGFGPERVDVRERWIALHARRLQFRDPKTREAVDVTAPLPDCWPAQLRTG